MKTSETLPLFKEPTAPEGFHYIPDFITLSEETRFITQLQKLPWQEVRMHGVAARRKVVHFGLDYTFDSREVTPTAPPPLFLRSLIERAAPLMSVKPQEIAETLISQYPPGAGIGWHRDAPAFGDSVFGISLAAPCTMKFRRKLNERYETLNIALEPRSAYVISGPARRDWQHSIPRLESLRYSITFRTLRSDRN